MAGGVDEVHNNFLTRTCTSFWHPGNAHVLRFNSDAAFAFNVHTIQVLITHFSLVDDVSNLQHAVGQSGLAVVNMRNDAEVTNPGGIGECRLREVLHRGFQTFRTIEVIDLVDKQDPF